VPKLRAKRKIFVLSWTLIAAGIILAVIGGTLAWHQRQQNEAADKQAAAAQYLANHGHATGSNPSTIKPKPDAFASWRVPADEPRYIFIPEIDVKAMVKPTWQTKDGAIGTPTNVYDTSWYVHSAKPGQPGATFIDGHVSSSTSPGVFYKLRDLQSGDKIQIEKGDGTRVTYRVVKKVFYAYDSVNMEQALAPVNPNKSSLTLMTCAGDVIPHTHTFSQRIAIFAEET
jgi:sortase (surface protein transpeptidase)